MYVRSLKLRAHARRCYVRSVVAYIDCMRAQCPNFSEPNVAGTIRHCEAQVHRTQICAKYVPFVAQLLSEGNVPQLAVGHWSMTLPYYHVLPS